jgi:hypothetical protein
MLFLRLLPIRRGGEFGVECARGVDESALVSLPVLLICLIAGSGQYVDRFRDVMGNSVNLR